MKKEFWLERWERSEIGFHEGVVNAYLARFWQEVQVTKGARVFVPLCGKSVDMLWLREQGHPVVGVELSDIAVQAFFSENRQQPAVNHAGRFDRYSANDIEILCGDFFELSREDLKGVSAVYDRASMIALPPEMRKKYVQHLLSILPQGCQLLLVTMDYPQQEMQGPPFALSAEEVQALYGASAEIRVLAREDALALNPRFRQRGVTRLEEAVYLLTVR